MNSQYYRDVQLDHGCRRVTYGIKLLRPQVPDNPRKSPSRNNKIRLPVPTIRCSLGALAGGRLDPCDSDSTHFSVGEGGVRKLFHRTSNHAVENISLRFSVLKPSNKCRPDLIDEFELGDESERSQMHVDIRGRQRSLWLSFEKCSR